MSMRKRTNKFNKALKHIKSTKIDDKLSMLESAPTNSTSGLYYRVDGTTTVTVQDPENPTSPDFTGIDFDIDGEDGKDTSGLFDSTGNSLFVSPPGDNSYILGPMAAQWYGWANQTRIGYIRESDRRVVNLGRISGRITEWDGSSSKFYSYGQLTLEQALWFRDIGKKDGDTSHDGNYRAFYPGPPTGGSDIFGRYLAIIVGVPLATTPNFTTQIQKAFADLPIDKEALANFAAMLARLKTGSIKMDNPFPLYEPILDAIAKMTGNSAEKDNVDFYMRKFIPDLLAGKNPTGSTPDNPIDNSSVYNARTISQFEELFKNYQKEMNGEKGPLDNSWEVEYDLNYRLKNSSIGNTTGQLDPNAGDGFIENGDGTVTFRKAFDFDRYNDQAGASGGTAFPAMLYGIMSGIPGLLVRSGGKTPTMYTGITFDKKTGKVIPNYKAGSRPSDDTNQSQDNTQPSVSYTAAEAELALEISNIELRLARDASTQVNRSQSQIDADNQELLKLQQRQDKMKAKREELNAKRARGEYVDSAEYRNLEANANIRIDANDDIKLAGTYDLMKRGQVPFLTPSQVNKILVDPKYQKLLQDDPDLLPILQRMRVKNNKNTSSTMVAHYQPTGKVLSESRKIEILKNIKKPVVVRETKQKKYKVSPGKRFLEKRAKTNFQGMDKLVGDVKPQKSFKKPDNIWSTGWQKYNAKLSQGKKNIVLEKIGEGKEAWNYMLNHGAAMDAKNLEEFWGKNPDFYSYFFNGKKYRPIRKEQVKGDYIVFLVDEFGANSNMLQSELNAKLAEEDDKKLLVEYKKLYGKFYNKLDPISANSMPPTGDPEIDAIVDKQKTKSKTKLYDRLKVKIKKDLTNK